MTFADKLRDLRLKAQLAQDELATRSGVQLGSVRNYEQGIREPTWRALLALASALQVDPRVFAECEDGPPSQRPRGRPKTKGGCHAPSEV